jgi:hypothetical protein
MYNEIIVCSLDENFSKKRNYKVLLSLDIFIASRLHNTVQYAQVKLLAKFSVYKRWEIDLTQGHYHRPEIFLHIGITQPLSYRTIFVS